jgi:hypothetical protein
MFSIQDPGFASKNLSILAKIRIPDPDLDFLPILDPGSRMQELSRIPDAGVIPDPDL